MEAALLAAAHGLDRGEASSETTHRRSARSRSSDFFNGLLESLVVTWHGRAGRIGLLLLLGALSYSGWRSIAGTEQVRPTSSTSACSCASARRSNGWCAACGRGYVAALEIRSQVLFDGLDAHGHQLDAAVMTCAACKRLMRSGGFCESCRFGWVGGLAYMSRLTYALAKGRVLAPGEARCELCRDLAGDMWWCAGCGTGWTGNVTFADRIEYESAVREFALLRSAIATSTRCEMCALVLLVDGTCPSCKISYEAGRHRAD